MPTDATQDSTTEGSQPGENGIADQSAAAGTKEGGHAALFLLFHRGSTAAAVVMVVVVVMVSSAISASAAAAAQRARVAVVVVFRAWRVVPGLSAVRLLHGWCLAIGKRVSGLTLRSLRLVW